MSSEAENFYDGLMRNQVKNYRAWVFPANLVDADKFSFDKRRIWLLPDVLTRRLLAI
ncbi:hypothetical protein M422DRAFT_264990 [Sphaerobolus stellatus SS14]|uniref:Uncharacterized protein n=1 Tax=Sphaerobolus stellatus (strain SS14) TaxID=990650 RepID=A0A0C9V6Z6_SPHS4|nr:hypothetical protein M422DRAFT_264990 [Sphaerobolus stellatus SS14]